VKRRTAWKRERDDGGRKYERGGRHERHMGGDGGTVEASTSGGIWFITTPHPTG